MTTYKEPFRNSFIKNLKQFFGEVLNNTQPIIISIVAGTGWDWLCTEGSKINICIDETEIVQCNLVQENFVVYTNFGHGYCFVPIPLNHIDTIFIGKEISENYIYSPVYTEAYNLPASVRKVIFQEYEPSEKEILND